MSCCPISGSFKSKDFSTNTFASKSGSVCNLCVSNLDVANLTVTNTINIPATPVVICADYPLDIVGPANCVQVVPGFCGSVLQYIRGNWGIYRSPGMTEVTVGNAGDGVAPGAAYRTVTDALADAQGPNTNCFFIRITDDTTEPGSITFPGPAVIYIDPNVRHTVNGFFSSDFDLTILGAINQNSSALVFNSTSTFIQGTGSVYVNNLNITNNGTSFFFEGSNFPRHLQMQNIFYSTGSPLGFIADVGAPLEATLNNITLNGLPGGLAASAISISNNLSQVSVSYLWIKGEWNPLIFTLQSTTDTITWSNIVNQATTPVEFILSCDVNNIRDESGTANMNLMTANTRVTDATVGVMTLAQVRVTLTNIRVLGDLGGGLLPLAQGTIIQNLVVLGTTLVTSTLTEQCKINGMTLGGAWTYDSIDLPTQFIALNQIVINGNWTCGFGLGHNIIDSINVTGLCSMNRTVLLGSVGAFVYINKISVNGVFLFGSGAGNSGCICNIQNASFNTGGTIFAERDGAIFHLSEFRVGGLWNIFGALRQAYVNGIFAFDVMMLPAGSQLMGIHFESVFFVRNFTATAVASFLQQVSLDNCMFFGGQGFTISLTNCAHWQFNNITHFYLSQFNNNLGFILFNGCSDIVMNNMQLTVDFVCDVACSNINISNSVFAGMHVIQTAQPLPGITLQRFHFLASQSSLSNVCIGACNGSAFSTNMLGFGFGTNDNGDFEIKIGTNLPIPANANYSNSQTVHNLLIYPKRKATLSATAQPAGDILNAPGLINEIGFYGKHSKYSNIRICFYPGGDLSANLPPVLQTGHYNNGTDVQPTVNIGQSTISMDSSFHGFDIGWVQDIPSIIPSTLDNRGVLRIDGDDVTMEGLNAFQVDVHGLFSSLTNARLRTSTTTAARWLYHPLSIGATITGSRTFGFIPTTTIPGITVGHPLCIGTRNFGAFLALNPASQPVGADNNNP